MGERLRDRKPKEYDLIINIPPGSSKSTIATILYPVWLWTIDSTLKILSGSGGQTLALDHAVKSRTVIQSPRFKELYPEITLKEDQNNKSAYETTAKGLRAATSVGSGIIGKHFHLHIVDDPLEADPSENDKQVANEWLFTRLSTRKVNKDITPLILIMQRLAEDDCTAMLLSKKKRKIKHICLPAELTESTSEEYRQFYVNGLFDPIRMSRETLGNELETLFERGYSCQYLQNPIPLDGGILKKSQFKIKEYSVAELNAMKWELFVDSAYTEKQENDPSALLLATNHENSLIIRHVSQLWKEFPDLIKEINKVKTIYNPRLINVEPKASGKSIVQSMRKAGVNITELESTVESKLTRVNSVSNVVQGGRVILVKDDWNNLFLSEATAFPLGLHDDMLDCMCYAIRKLLHNRSRLNYSS